MSVFEFLHNYTYGYHVESQMVSQLATMRLCSSRILLCCPELLCNQHLKIVVRNQQLVHQPCTNMIDKPRLTNLNTTIPSFMGDPVCHHNCNFPQPRKVTTPTFLSDTMLFLRTFGTLVAQEQCIRTVI